jgi:lipoprotein-anchoring transpeptidase ErfK/SrfK
MFTKFFAVFSMFFLVNNVCIREILAATKAEAINASSKQLVVVIDISEQQVSVVKHQKNIFTTGTVTGKSATPTDYGVFSIKSKQRNTRLKGAGYNVPVSYWMPYNGGEGLHDASWRQSWEFGVPGHNWQNGSHGCDNLSLKSAETIWNLVVVGTPVYVIE